MKVPLFKIISDETELQKTREILVRGTYWANGPEIQEFEENISDFIGSKYCLVFNSGTSALQAVLQAFGVEQKEVIVPSFTFISTANSVLHAGGKPVFADIETETYGLDPKSVIEKISERTKAIMPVHYAGGACKIEEIKEIAQEHDLILIEDAAEAFGALIGNRKLGTFGHAAMFSFAPNKIITTGEGGCIVTDSKEIYEKLKLIRSHGRLETEEYFASILSMDYVTLGYNFRMPTICAAVGLAQLARIDEVIKKRREIANYYNKKLDNINGLKCPVVPENSFHVYQLYSILLEERKKRDLLQQYLYDNGISSKVYFTPAHKSPFYEKELGYSTKLKITEDVSERILTIPLHLLLKKEEMDYVIEKIFNFFNK